jgi:hypothetical protein
MALDILAPMCSVTLLQGPLPVEYAKLPRLLRLSLRNNSISGSFTLFQEGLPKLSPLLYLDVSANEGVEGSFLPDAFLRTGMLQNLDGLDNEAKLFLKGTPHVLDLNGLGLTGNISPAFVQVHSLCPHTSFAHLGLCRQST